MARSSLLVVLVTVACLSAASADVNVDVVEVFPMNLPRAIISGIGFHEGELQAIAMDNVLYRYDTATGQLLEEVRPLLSGLPQSHLHGMAVGPDGTFWVNETFSGQIYRVAFDGYTVILTIDGPPGETPAFDLAWDWVSLWVSRHSFGPPTPIHQVDPSTGDILQLFDLGVADVHGLYWIGDYLWVLDNVTDKLHQVDRFGAITETFVLPADSYRGMAHDGQHLWTSNDTRFLHIEATPNPCPPPGEVRELTFPDQDTLLWQAPLVLGGLPTTYDVLRSDAAGDFLLAVCVEGEDPADSSVVDSQLPQEAGVFHYLVRAWNGCAGGEGTLGSDSNDDDRLGAYCPAP